MSSSLLRKIVILKILLLIFLQFRFAFAYEMDLDILRLYLSDNPKILAVGGIDLNCERQNIDLYHPARLVLLEKSYISYIIIHENVYDEEDSKWERIRIKSKEKRLTGIINKMHEGIIKKGVVAFQYSDDTAEGQAHYTREDFQLDYKETTRNGMLTLAVQTGDFFAFGGGFQDYREKTDYFWEAALRVDPFFSLGIRDFKREFNLDLTIEKDDIYGRIPINYSEDVLEMTLNMNLHRLLSACFIVDARHLDRKAFRLTSNITKGISLTYFRQYGDFIYQQDVFVDGLDSGHNNGDAEYAQWIAGVTFKHNEYTTYHLNVRHFYFTTNGAGLVQSDAVLSFWENLLAGKRYFNYNAGLDSMQYHFGVESQWTKRLNIRFGLQYIDIEPTGIFDDWTPFPLIGIGRLDEHISDFSYKRINLGVLAAGFSYRIKNLEFTYGLGQYLLLSSEKKDETVGGAEGGAEEGDEWYRISWDDIKEVWETIKDNPGGTLHAFEIRWFF